MTTSAWADAMVVGLDRGFRAGADPERAGDQAAYMRDHFVFHGLTAAEYKAVASAAMKASTQRCGSEPTEADLDALARACYERTEREWHYAAVHVLRRRVATLTPASIPLVEHLVRTHSWWDTVDAIASHVAGGIVERFPETVSVMDEWAMSDHLWLARTAILHQLRYKEATDADRLFRYCLERADEPDFFARKAIGWALRQYARTDPDAVRAFCATHQGRLSPLSLREARKHL